MAGPKHSVHADAEALVADAKAYVNAENETQRRGAGEKFTQDWQRVAQSEPEYRDQVKAEAKQIANGSWNPYVPGATVDGESISFNGGIASDNRKLVGWNDGAVQGVGWTKKEGADNLLKPGVPRLVAEEQKRNRQYDEMYGHQ